MIAILTEKPLFAKELARIVGATKRETGYMSGNGYLVTWTLGHLLTLAMPKEYGRTRRSGRIADTPAHVPASGTAGKDIGRIGNRPGGRKTTENNQYPF